MAEASTFNVEVVPIFDSLVDGLKVLRDTAVEALDAFVAVFEDLRTE